MTASQMLCMLRAVQSALESLLFVIYYFRSARGKVCVLSSISPLKTQFCDRVSRLRTVWTRGVIGAFPFKHSDTCWATFGWTWVASTKCCTYIRQRVVLGANQISQTSDSHNRLLAHNLQQWQCVPHMGLRHESCVL